MNSDQLKIKSCCPPKTDLIPSSNASADSNYNPGNHSGSSRRSKLPEGSSAAKHSDSFFNLCHIPGGPALVGTARNFISSDEESPVRHQELKPFQMMQTSVTNAMFKAFIEDTGYKTEAQRYGWSFVFFQQLPEQYKPRQSAVGSQWWCKVDGADWKHVGGPSTANALLDEHPVVHVSWNDAKVFADWAGGRLPTEAEWEHAARGGLGDVLFPWGNQEPDDHSFQPCNIWQGSFPSNNSCLDGFASTAPAKSFGPNQYGLYNMCGNVWEWTSGRFKLNGRSAAAKQYAKHFKGTKTLKGGSYLCHKSYCFRYRIAARTGSTPDSTTSHQGFRLVFS